jgi:formate-dependent phosphoribosylglycinamide formyltransferase (GAR transformylase)
MLTQGIGAEAKPRAAVFVAPFFAETTVRFIKAAAGLPGVRLGLISQDPVGTLPAEVRRLLAAHYRIENGLDAQQIAGAVRALSRELGPPVRVLGALEQLQVALAQVRELLDIEGMGVEVAHNFRDKARMKDVLRQAGVPCARHALAETRSQARDRGREIGFPLVVKPPAGAGARHTYRVEDQASLEQSLNWNPPAPSRPVLLEEFIVGEEHSFDAVTIGGKPVWHSLTHYMPGPLEVMREPWIQWSVLLPREVDHPHYDSIREVGFKALQALGIGTSLTHMEWFRRADGSIAVSEVAARPPGAQFTTLMSYAHDMDFYRAWARLMLFDAFDPPERKFAAGIVFLRGQGRGVVKAIHGLDRAQQELGSLVAEVRLPREGQAAASSYEGEGFVVLRHPETAVVRQALKRLVSLVRVELG